MWIKSANDFIQLRIMDLLIISILISMININKISADKYCRKLKTENFLQKNESFCILVERTCTSNVSQWCCSCK